jgi:hypothetical protein
MVERTREVALTQDLEVYGYPTGLPVKVSTNVWVQRDIGSKRFYANGDLFAGSSGGPALDVQTGVVQGFAATEPLPRFSEVSEGRGFCHIYRTCADSGCGGTVPNEDLSGFMRVTQVPAIPLHPALTPVVL